MLYCSHARCMYDTDVFQMKAEESLAGAESEFANGRYNNCANRCYYACFQAAITALLRSGIKPAGERGEVKHTVVQAQFVGQLVHRQKKYNAAFKDILARTLVLRQMADYETEQVGKTQASRALRRTRDFFDELKMKGGEN